MYLVGSPDPPVFQILALLAAPVAAIATTDANLAAAHGLDWVRASRADLPLNGNIPFRQWSVKSAVVVAGDILYPGGPMNRQQEQMMSPLDYFLLMFPPKQLTTTGEFLKWFGLIILTTRFEFASRALLWLAIATSKFFPAPQFGGLTGMSRNRFDEFVHCNSYNGATNLL
jgi:hypothetical protein